MAERQQRFLSGNEACALGAMYAGLDFFAGYPITPSTEIAELLARELPRRGGVFIQMEDEIASLAAVLGASLAGAKAMTATSGPGFSLMQEHIGYGAMAEVPCVVVNVQRGGPSTGLPTMPAQGDVMQVLDEIVGHIAERAALPAPGEIPLTARRRPTVPPGDFLPYKPDPDGVPPMAGYGEGYRFHVTGLNHDETGFPSNEPRIADALVRRLTEKVEAHRDEIVDVQWTRSAGARVGIFAYGSTARAARAAVRLLAVDELPVTLLRPTVLWPFPDGEVRQLGAEVERVVVPEMNLGQMSREVERACRGSVRVERLSRVDGLPITPDQIVDAVRRAP
jgi:2-oxoglutarate ferredoxin oxidoreductase subunit alpha